MEYYLLRLSYSTSGWQHIRKQAATFDQRMDPVRKLIAHLGGSFATFGFYDRPPFQGKTASHTVLDKFITFGTNDLMAVLAMPSKEAAHAFRVALSSQPGIETIELVAMMPFEDAITSARTLVDDAIAATGYAGPG